MNSPVTQSYANHTRLDPLFHFTLLPLQAITFLLTIWNLIRNPGLPAVVILLLAMNVMITALKARTYPLKAQDRVIRLEERLRLSTLLPESLRSRIGELTEGQLIALRFAPDAEVASLVEKALANRWKPKEIKQAIQQWRPDYFRV